MRWAGKEAGWAWRLVDLAAGRLDLGAQLDQERVNTQRPAYSSGRLVSARTKQRHGEAGLERGGEELGGWQQAALGMPASVEDGAPGSVKSSTEAVVGPRTR